MKRRKFSRWMLPPPPSPPLRPWHWAVAFLAVAAIVGLLARAFIRAPVPMTVVVILLAIVTVIASQFTNKNLKRLATTRDGEDIGTFASAFNRRSKRFDPWVIRATWDALAPYTTFSSDAEHADQLPLRATDNLIKDLHIDPLDLENVVEEVALRSGRDLRRCERNPYFGRIETVGQLVQFVFNQPMLPN